MPDRSEAQAAIENLNGKGLLGRQMNVNEASPSAHLGRSGGQGGHNERPGYGGRTDLGKMGGLSGGTEGTKK